MASSVATGARSGNLLHTQARRFGTAAADLAGSSFASAYTRWTESVRLAERLGIAVPVKTFPPQSRRPTLISAQSSAAAAAMGVHQALLAVIQDGQRNGHAQVVQGLRARLVLPLRASARRCHLCTATPHFLMLSSYLGLTKAANASFNSCICTKMCIRLCDAAMRLPPFCLSLTFSPPFQTRRRGDMPPFFVQRHAGKVRALRHLLDVSAPTSSRAALCARLACGAG